MLRLASTPDRDGRLLHVERLPDRAENPGRWPPWVPSGVVTVCCEQGIRHPWSHQMETAEHAYAGRHAVVSTGTASGKSLGYLLPALATIHAGRRGDDAADPDGRHRLGSLRDRGPTVLYVSPTKALARDQLTTVESFAAAVPTLRAAPVDGDNDREARAWAREHANYIVTNPDLLHRTMLPGHARWARFLTGLTYVVVDECHYYRGVFGSHVAQVLRRLRRICAHYGAEPTFVCASATVDDPALAAERLTGLPAVVVTDDGSPRLGATVVLWEPPLSPGGGENGAPVRRSATAEVADLLTDLVVDGVRTLAFVRSRRGAETIAISARRQLDEIAPELHDQVSTYRAGYLPEDRRALEQALKSGQLTGLAATSALELGIDVAGLDAVLVAGFPGTRAALWQQFGRAGRGGGASLGVLVARDDPLDTYLVRHPQALLGAPVEATVLDPDNPYVLGPHLCAAAQELPLIEQDLRLFGPGSPQAVEALTEGGLLRRRPRGWFWTSRERAADLADIRSTGGNPVQIVLADTGRLLGTVDAGAAHSTVHDGAVYLHQGETYVVESFDVGDGVAVVRRDDPDYTTTAREITEIAVLNTELEAAWGACTLAFGSVRVRHQVVGYLVRRLGSGEVMGEEPLTLPERSLVTKAVWWTVPPEGLVGAGLAEADLPGSAHAAEHASIGLLPLFATCDRWDIGGVSTAMHPDTGMLTVFVHDGHPGGAGFAARGYAEAADWLRTTRSVIAECECDDGCPSCVQSPKCGNGNHPLDKAGAVRLLDLLLAGAPRGRAQLSGSC